MSNETNQIERKIREKNQTYKSDMRKIHYD